MTYQILDDATDLPIPPDTVYYSVNWNINGTFGDADFANYDDVLVKVRQIQQMAFNGTPSRHIEIKWQKTRPLPS